MDAEKTAKDVVYRWYKAKGSKTALERAIARVVRLALRRGARLGREAQ